MQLTQTGITEDGKPIVSGVFAYSGTLGLPLEITLDKLNEYGIVIDWQDYVSAAMKDGQKVRTIKARIIAAIGDVFGPVYRDEFMKRLEKLLDA